MRKVKVWDVFVRSFHWGVGLLVLGSFLTSEQDRLLAIHVRLGLAVLALVTARVAWGFVGPEPARFATFVKRPREVLAYARELGGGRPRRHLSHNPLGGAMVVALLAVLAGLVATGLLTYAGPEYDGALRGLLSRGGAHAVKEVHEALFGVLLGLVGLHVAGVVASSLLERQNLVLGMITGYKRTPAEVVGDPAPGPGRAGRLARAAATVALGVAVAVGAALLLGLPARAHAAPPASPAAAELLRGWEAEARRADAGFQGFSAAEGRKLYASEHVQDGERTSCAACHTADPRQRGRTPAGKLVEPMAPSVNPARLTDRGEVEKWFRRNCKQVLGRECTAAEKGHFVTYLLGA